MPEIYLWRYCNQKGLVASYRNSQLTSDEFVEMVLDQRFSVGKLKPVYGHSVKGKHLAKARATDDKIARILET